MSNSVSLLNLSNLENSVNSISTQLANFYELDANGDIIITADMFRDGNGNITNLSSFPAFSPYVTYPYTGTGTLFSKNGVVTYALPTINYDISAGLINQIGQTLSSGIVYPIEFTIGVTFSFTWNGGSKPSWVGHLYVPNTIEFKSTVLGTILTDTVNSEYFDNDGTGSEGYVVPYYKTYSFTANNQTEIQDFNLDITTSSGGYQTSGTYYGSTVSGKLVSASYLR